MSPEIFIIATIEGGCLSVMPRPGVNQPLADDIRAIADEGYDQVVSLLAQDEAQELGLAQEAALVQAAAMEFTAFPIDDFTLPEPLQAFSEFTYCHYQNLMQGRKIVLHCRAGIGRSGMTAAAILIHSGQTADAAFDQISRCRGVEVPDTAEQKDWIRSNQVIIAEYGAIQAALL
ncbi:MAG: protein-tyrosine phosphatase [Planctomycetota bacterium]|jgi:protein-tyrosine phosphatase